MFYWDYAIGIFLISLILALTMGSTGNDASSFLNNVHSADTSNIVSTLVGGAIFNLANLLLVAAIDMAGLAIAFPVSIGIALVVGVISSYALQPRGTRSCSRGSSLRGHRRDYGRQSLWQSGQRRAIGFEEKYCHLHRFWSSDGALGPVRRPCHDRGNTLGPYSTAVFLTLGALLSCSIWNVYFMKNPLVGDPVNFADYFRGPASGHVLGFRRSDLGHGMVFNLVAARFTGVAISYAIGQSAPMVAALWGVLAWKEFKGAGSKAYIYLFLMFVFYGLAIALVAQANG